MPSPVHHQLLVADFLDLPHSSLQVAILRDNRACGGLNLPDVPDLFTTRNCRGEELMDESFEDKIALEIEAQLVSGRTIALESGPYRALIDRQGAAVQGLYCP